MGTKAEEEGGRRIEEMVEVGSWVFDCMHWRKYVYVEEDDVDDDEGKMKETRRKRREMKEKDWS